MRDTLGRLLTAMCMLAVAGAAFGQEQPPAQPQPIHAHAPDDPVTLFPTRDASGTAWLPSLTPMSGVHGRVHGWELMLHGDAFAQFLYESGDVHRGSHQAGSINWMMGMARRPVGEGWLGLRAMVSLEPWTIPGCGYPDLLATGEVCDGDTIHDRQHPHDLFMEIAVEYRPAFEGVVAVAGLRRSRRGTRPRTSSVSTPTVRVREPHRANLAPLVGCHSHHIRPRLGRCVWTTMEG